MQICTRLKEFARKLVYKDGAKTIPLSTLLVVFTVTFFSGWIWSVVISFLPHLVQWFGIDETDTGFNVGVIGTSLFLGAFISGPTWGYLSDCIGHRKCVIATSVCCVVTTVAFGCSKSMNWAIVTRFCQGLSLGQAIPLQALLKDVCDDTNVALGMTVLLSAFSFGNIMGPSLGAFTAFPSKLYPQIFSKYGVFGTFPALLPNLIVTTGIFIGILLTLTLLPADSIQNENSKITDNRKDGKTPLLQDSHASFLDAGTNADDSCFSSSDNEAKEPTTKNNMVDGNVVSRLSMFIDQLRNSDFVKVLRTKECIICCIIILLSAVMDVGFEQMFPILACTDPEYKGLGLEPSQVGTVFMIVSLIQTIFQLTLLPKILNCFGPRKLLIICNILNAIYCPLLPAVALLKDKNMVWVGLIVVILIVRTCAFAAYISLNIIVNNCMDADVIGSAVGITAAAKCAGKLLSPIACGGIYSWSLKNIKGVPGNDGALGFPFDQFLAFFFLSFLAVLCMIGAMLLPQPE